MGKLAVLLKLHSDYLQESMITGHRLDMPTRFYSEDNFIHIFHLLNKRLCIKDLLKLERWLSGKEGKLLFQRTRVQSPALMVNVSQLPITPSEGDLTPSSDLHGCPYMLHTQRNTRIYLSKDKSKNMYFKRICLSLLSKCMSLYIVWSYYKSKMTLFTVQIIIMVKYSSFQICNFGSWECKVNKLL